MRLAILCLLALLACASEKPKPCAIEPRWDAADYDQCPKASEK
jgi:hypothetical protein